MRGMCGSRGATEREDNSMSELSVCDCGCGESFTPKRRDQRCINRRHYGAAWRREHREYAVLKSGERDALKRARKVGAAQRECVQCGEEFKSAGSHHVHCSRDCLIEAKRERGVTTLTPEELEEERTYQAEVLMAIAAAHEAKRRTRATA